MYASTRTARRIEGRGNAPVTGSDVRVDYYTSQPAPMQWVAVATVTVDRLQDATAQHHRLVVGVGPTENAAMADMATRLSMLDVADRTLCGE